MNPPRERLRASIPDLRVLRDDGHLCTLLGRAAPGAVTPLLPALTGLLVVGTLLAAVRGELAGITLFAPAAALLLSGPSSGHPHDGRFDRLVPLVLRATEYGYLVVLGLASGVPGPLVFVLLVVVACHHRDGVCRPAVGVARPAWVRRAALGWDGRMLVLAVGGAFGALTPAYGVLASYLAVLLVREAVRSWSTTPVTEVCTTVAPPCPGDGDGPEEPAAPPHGHTDGGRPAAGTNGEA